MAESKAGSFNAYLEYSQRGQKSSPGAAGPASLLSVFSHTEKRVLSLAELADMSGVNASTFREYLKKLSDSGFVEVSGPLLEETVKLTDKGSDMLAVL